MNKTKFLFSLLMAIVMMAMCPSKMWADEQPQGNNVIIYTATEKLPVFIDKGRGIHTLAFEVNITDHEFSNGTGTITFSGDVTSIGDKAFFCCSGLRTISLPSSVTSIGTNAFYGCSGLRTISLPSSVKSIGMFAFNECSGLTSIHIPDGTTEIGIGAFMNCKSLREICIPSSVTTIGSMAFKDCYVVKNGITNHSSKSLEGTFLTIVDAE